MHICKLVHVQMHVLTQQYASICTYRVHMHEETKDDDSPKTDTATGLRAHILNINMHKYIISAQRHEKDG